MRTSDSRFAGRLVILVSISHHALHLRLSFAPTSYKSDKCCRTSPSRFEAALRVLSFVKLFVITQQTTSASDNFSFVLDDLQKRRLR
ncbi:hypothetical protein BT63DRAFT_424118 [Microthyrium microscopicum]|uniref:Uncharacterized protein n=1 Tax=Microthyrium microscopicum TaxID=703497 RepID=A0A6A6UH03_9PEZI|nr:hypothetical protein BT63DRAFT_424118 [Microthyrium microscopicum]